MHITIRICIHIRIHIHIHILYIYVYTYRHRYTYTYTYTVGILICICINTIYKYWTIRHRVGPVPEWKKLTMPEQVLYRTKPMQSGIFLVRYWNKIMDAGVPMPVLVSLMPMPSYGRIILVQPQASPA